MSKLVDILENDLREKYPEVLENSCWDPAGRIDEIKFPNGRVFSGLDMRFGGEW